MNSLKKMNMEQEIRFYGSSKHYRLRLFLIILFFSVSSMVAAQFSFEGIITDLPAQHKGNVILEYWGEDGWKQAGNSPLTSDGKFVIQPKTSPIGQWRIRLTSDPKKWGDFILGSESPKQFNLKLSYNQLNMQAIRIDGTEESEAYYQLMSAYAQFLLNKDSLKRDSRERLKEEQVFIQKAENIRLAHRGKFISEIVIPCITRPLNTLLDDSSIPMDSVLAWNARNGINRIPFGDERILHHFGLMRSLNYHFQYFYENNLVNAYIDQLMPKAFANENVQAFMFKFVLEKMLDYKHEEGLAYLIEHYATDCTDNENLPEATKNLITALERNKPGQIIENLILPDTSGKLIDLSSIYKKNKVTLLMFWRANCSHCKEFEPELEEIYQEYKSKGVEVYAIGTDKEEAQWKEQAVINRSPWPSVFLAYTARGNFSKRFPVPSTPTLIAVDQNGKILRRLIIRSKLKATLDEMLREVN